MFPVDVVFRNMESDPTLETSIVERAQALAKVHRRIERCRIVIDRPHQHRVEGGAYAVRIHCAVPGDDVVIETHIPAPELGDRESIRRRDTRKVAHRDLSVVLHEAFDAARRRLRERARTE